MARTLEELGIDPANLPRRPAREGDEGDAMATIRAQGDPDGVHVLRVFGVIDSWGYATDRLKMELEGIDPDVPLRVVITSPGGDPFEALTMYDMLARHEGEVETEIQGFAQSGAAYLAMVGENRRMGDKAFLMVHGCVISDMYGKAKDVEAMADLMRQVDDVQAKIFAEATGQSEETVREWLEGPDTWFNAARAVEVGLAHEIVPSEELTAEGRLRLDTVSEALQAENPPPQFLAAMGRLLTQESTMSDPKTPQDPKTPKIPASQTDSDAIREAMAAALPEALGEALPGALEALGIKPEPKKAGGEEGGEPAKPKAEKDGEDPAAALTEQLTALNTRLDAMEAQRAEERKAERKARIRTELDRVVRSGQLPPALREVWEATLEAAKGDAFEEHLGKLRALPVTGPGHDPDLEAQLGGLTDDEAEALQGVTIPQQLLPLGVSADAVPANVQLKLRRSLAAAKGKTGEEAWAAFRNAAYEAEGQRAPASGNGNLFD